MKNRPKEEVTSFVESFVIDLSRGVVGTMELLVQESRERHREEREQKRLRAVALIDRAVEGGYRVTREDIAKYFYNDHLSVKQLADALQIPLPHLNKALKRWYHFS